MDTHTPYSPKHEILKHFDINKLKAFRVICKHFLRKQLTAEEIEFFKILYDMQIYQIDLALSKYLPKIMGNSNDTYVIITADHGEEFMENGRIGHASILTRTLLHVPLIIYGGELKPRIVDIKASLIDLAPTILDLLGLKIPSFFKETSLLRKEESEQVIAQGIFNGKRYQRML